MLAADVFVERGSARGYCQAMNLDESMRQRILDAMDQDTKGRRGRKRSIAQIAEEAAVELGTDPTALADQLRKYRTGQTGISLERRIAVAKVLGHDLLWLLGGTRHLSGNRAGVPVIDSGRYPVNATPEARQTALLQAAAGSQEENPTTDPDAHWVRLQDTFGDYRSGDMVLVSPQEQRRDVAAIVRGRFVVGVITPFKGDDCLVVPPNEIHASSDYAVVGGITHHLIDKRTR